MSNNSAIFTGVATGVVSLGLLIFAIRSMSVGVAQRHEGFESPSTLFASAPSYMSAPEPRFGNMNLLSTLHYPVVNKTNNVSAIPPTPCTSGCGAGKPDEPFVLPPPSIIVDRLIFANRNSQLRAMGDPIRGDLPIVPNPPGWFTPSVTPQIDLQRGALNFLAGANLPGRKLDMLFEQSAAGLMPQSTIPFVQTTGNAYAQLGNRGQDLVITSTP
jgi:hypothetical protein